MADPIDKFVDRNGVTQDKEFLVNSINEAIAALDNFTKKSIGLGQANGLKQAGAALEEVAAAQVKFSQATEQAAAALIKKQQENVNAQRQVDKAMQEGRVVKQAYNAELKREVELQNAANGSIEQARALVKNLTAERNKLNLTTEEGRKRQAELNAEINKANEFIRQNVDALAKQKINIGNYEGSAKIIVEAMERARQKVAQTTNEFGKNAPEAAAARREYEALQRITENPQFLNIAAKVGDANAELKFFTRQLIDLERNGQGSSTAARDLRVQLAQLTDQIADAKAEVKALSSDTRQFDLVASGVSSVASALQTAAGVSGLFGASQEEVAKKLQFLSAVENTANGVRAIANDLTTRGTAANKAYAFVQGLVATALDTSAASAVRARAAFGLLGVVVTVVGAIAVAYALLSRKADEAAIRQENLNSVMKEASGEYAKAVETVNDLRGKIELAKQGFISKKEVVEQFNGTIGKTTGQVKDLEGAEKSLTKNGPAFIQMTFAKATATAALAKAAQLAVEAQLELLSPSNKKLSETVQNFGLLSESQKRDFKEAAEKETQQKINSLNKQANDLIVFAQQKQKEAAQISAQNGFSFFGTADKGAADKAKIDLEKIALERKKIQLEAEADIQKQIIEIESFGNDARLKALNRYIAIKKEIIDAEAEYEKSKKGITAAEIELIEARHQDNLRRLREDGFNLLKITNREEIEEQENHAYDMEQISKDLTDALLASTTDWLNKGAKAYDEDEAKFKATQERKKRLALQLASELINATNAILTAGFERQKNEIQDQINLLDEKKAKEIELANQTIASAQERAAAIAIIEARAQAQKEALIRKQKELDIKKAQFDKAAAIARIVQETAVSIISSLKTPALIPLIAAIAAAQLAAVIAQPIPRYFKGKNVKSFTDSYEGPAWVGDGGKPELHIKENGTAVVTPGRPTLTWVAKKDIILPDAKKALAAVTMDRAAVAGGSVGQGDQKDLIAAAINEMSAKVTRAIKDKPVLNMSADRSGLAAMWQFGANQIKYIEENTNW